MSNNQDLMHFYIRQKIYSLNDIAKFARVTTEFIQECERENLIQVTVMHGTVGYGHDTVRRLIRIRHLHRDLGLDLTAIDCILRMRRKIGDLKKQMNDMQRRMLAREQELTAEIQRLRRQLAQESVYSDSSGSRKRKAVQSVSVGRCGCQSALAGVLVKARRTGGCGGGVSAPGSLH